MGKVYKKLVESFGYIAEAPGDAANSYAGINLSGNVPAGDPSPMKPGDTRYAPGYNPNTGSSYTGDIGDAPNDPVKDNPTDKPKSKYNSNPGTRAYQHWLNSHGIKVAIDGKYGPETQAAASTMFEKIKAAKEKDLYEPRFQESQTMLGFVSAVLNNPICPQEFLKSIIDSDHLVFDKWGELKDLIEEAKEILGNRQ